MSLVQAAFIDELEKIASARVGLSLLGGAYGTYRGSRGIFDDQYVDDDRLASGLITRREWRRRNARRATSLLGGAALGATLGGSLPGVVSSARKGLVSTAKDVADPVAARFQGVIDQAVKDALRDLPAAAEDAGERAGKAIARGLHDVSVGENKSPVLRMKLEVPPGSIANRLFGGK
jgi:hypothetical protein